MTIRVDRGSLSEPPNDLGTNQGSFSVRWAVGPNFQNVNSDTPRPIRNAPVDPATPGPYGAPYDQSTGEPRLTSTLIIWRSIRARCSWINWSISNWPGCI